MSSHDEMSDEELWDRTHSDDVSDRADSLMELASRKQAIPDWDMAKSLYGSAADLYRDLEKESSLGHAIYSLGYCQYRLGEYEEAIKSLATSLQLGQEIIDSKVIAYSAGPLADCYSANGEPEKAIDFYEIAVDAFVEIEVETLAGINALAMGELHGIANRQTRALECFIRAFNIFQTGGDAIGAARAKDRMASALIEMGDYDQAVMHLKESHEVFEFSEVVDRATHALYRIGWTLNLAGKYLQAEGPLREAAVAFRQAGEWSRTALAETQLAYSLIFRDLETEHEYGQNLLRRAATYFEFAGELQNAWQVNSIKAELLALRGDLVAAIAIWKDILDQAISQEDLYYVRSARVNLAECLLEQGEITAAKEQLTEIDVAQWGENNVEIANFERVQKLVLEKLSETLNIELPK
jgi:tetratricopeptide (TPR) repeat protein